MAAEKSGDETGAEQGFQKSLWLATAEPEPQTGPLVGHHESDVVIVGAGITGLSTALHLTALGKSVSVVESRTIGWGASGRNGGQVNPAFETLPSGVRARFGVARGEDILKFVDNACDLVFDLIKRHQIQCEARRLPYLRAAVGRRGLRDIDNWVREWQAFGAPVERLSRQVTATAIGSDFFTGAMTDGRGGSLQPLSYVRGLARAAMTGGARLYTASPARTLSRQGAGWRLDSDDGAVVARHLVLATNGYTDGLWPGLCRVVVPVASLQTATEPLTEEAAAKILPFGHHVSETRRAMVYFRRDADGRFLIGGRGSAFRPTRQYADTTHLRREAIRLFPALRSVNWAYDWGGLVAITRNHLPQLVELAPSAHAALGYNGRGVAMATAMGQQLASLLTGGPVALPSGDADPFLLHAFRNLGVGCHMLRARLLDKFQRK